MKTTLLKSAVLVASVLGAISSASAETLYAKIPFGFSAGGTAMPAGAYTIRPMPGIHSALLFENETTKMQAIVLVRTAPAAPSMPAEPLTFFTGSSESRELAHIATTTWTYELSVRPATKSLKGAALAIVSASK